MRKDSWVGISTSRQRCSEARYDDCSRRTLGTSSGAAKDTVSMYDFYLVLVACDFSASRRMAQDQYLHHVQPTIARGHCEAGEVLTDLNAPDSKRLAPSSE